MTCPDSTMLRCALARSIFSARQDRRDLPLEAVEIVSHGDAERADQLVFAIPQQHVRRAQVLAEHVEGIRPEHQHIRDVGIADRNALDGRRHVDDAALVERHGEAGVARGAHDLIRGFLREN